MKKFSHYNVTINESVENNISTFSISDNSLNYISESDLKKYLVIADKFLMDESKEIINWLIVNNRNYISDLSNDLHENALYGFFKKFKNTKNLPQDKNELITKLKNVIGAERGLEIPVFQTKEEFDGIINGEYGADYVILRLNTEKGKNRVAEKYKPLMMKVCSQWLGKSTLTFDDLMNVAYETMAQAIKYYAKVSGTKASELVSKYNDKLSDEDLKDLKTIGYTFPHFLALSLRGSILGEIQNASHTVHIPRSQQSLERKQRGMNTRNHTISGDKKIGHDENSRTVFDMNADPEDGYSGINKVEIDKIWKQIYSELEKKFDKKSMEVWYQFNGLNGRTKEKGIDIAKKFGLTSSNITYHIYKINSYIQSNKRILYGMAQIHDMMNEELESSNDGTLN